MSTSDQQLLGRWGHLFEEDHQDVLVYRPADYDFPRARGRDGIEFRADGGYIDWAVGRGDAREPHPGSWQVDPGGRLRVTTASGQQRVFDVVSLAPDRLELIPRSES